MDIKEKDAYLSELLAREAISQDEFDDIIFRPSVNAFHSLYLSARFIDNINWGWSSWKAAKAQAVPEGFVLVRASDRDREICELIDQRDNMERLADQLKDKLQDLYKVDFGEYTSCNCPLKNAIEYDDSNLVLVPREPTEEMLGAAWEAPPAGGPSGNRRVFYEKQAVVYKAMVEEAEKEMIEAQEQNR